MYDSTVGRFINLDPLGFTAGDTNTGRYCGNSPTNFMDPSGTTFKITTDAKEGTLASTTETLGFYTALLTLGEKGGDLGKALVVATVSGSRQLNVNIAAGNSPEVLVGQHTPGMGTLYLPNTPNFLWPADARAAWVQMRAAAIATTKVGFLPGTGQGRNKKERIELTQAAKAQQTTILQNEIAELAPIYDSENGAALVLGHELGHAVIKLADPTPNTPYGGNVTLVENTLRDSLIGGVGGRSTYSGSNVPSQHMYEVAAAAATGNRDAIREFTQLYQAQTGNVPKNAQAAAKDYNKQLVLYNSFMAQNLQSQYTSGVLSVRQYLINKCVDLLMTEVNLRMNGQQ